MVTRREWLQRTIGGVAGALAAGGVPLLAEVATPITVYKNPTCGCCRKWVDHLRANGFAVTTRDMDDLSEVKATFGVPAALEGCHTATIGSYVVEGHVPADLIRKMLRDRPKIAGLAVPGMPSGTPGMEMGDGVPGHFDVLAFTRDGKTSVYASR